MSFIRPEVTAALKRWHEAIAGGALACLGLWLAFGSGGYAAILGYLVAATGAALAFGGIQRARFRTGSGGPGVVEITEGQVTYFGPTVGGSVAVADLTLIELDPRARPHPQWILSQNGQPPLAIPTTAEGAGALFDVFAALDGIRTERMLAQLKGARKQRVVIWQSPKRPRPVVAIRPALH